jgi:hypothetical protein
MVVFAPPIYTKSNQKTVTRLLDWYVPKDAQLGASVSTFSPLFLLVPKGSFEASDCPHSSCLALIFEGSGFWLPFGELWRPQRQRGNATRAGGPPEVFLFQPRTRVGRGRDEISRESDGNRIHCL